MDKLKYLKFFVAGLGSLLAFIFIQKQRIKNAKTEQDFFTRYDGLFKFHSLVNGLPDWRWLKAIAKQESSLGQDPRTSKGLVSYDGLSYGLMQIAPGTGSPKEIEIKGFGNKTLKEMSEPEKLLVQSKLNDPNVSIDKAARLVGYLWAKYGDKDKVFLAYNQGEKNTDRGKNYSHPNGQYAKLINDHLEWIKRKEKQYA